MEANKLKIKKGAFVALIALLALSCVFMLTGCSTVQADDTAQQEQAETQAESNDWGAYFKEKIAPTIATVITSILSIYLAISPILSKVKKASERFNNATDGVNATAKKGNENTAKIEAFTTKAVDTINNASEKLTSVLDGLDERISQIEKRTSNIEQITRIGFENNADLVRNGYAAEIGRVGKEVQDAGDGNNDKTAES